MSILKFFREELRAVIGAYSDGDKLYIARLTEEFETVTVDAAGSEVERLAEQIAHVCKQKGWATSAVGLCLREEDAVTFRTEIDNVPAKEIPALVKSWAVAQAGAEAIFSFVQIGGELWMETLPRIKAETFRAAFKRFGLTLRALSVMPVASEPIKPQPYDRTRFISEVVRDKKAPNLLGRGGAYRWKRISFAAASIILGVLTLATIKIFCDYREASERLIAAKTTFDALREDFYLKQAVDDDTASLRRLNTFATQTDAPNNFNRLINLGGLADGSVRLIRIDMEENFLELEGATIDGAAAVRNYLARVKETVVQSARLESTVETADGEIIFTIRAAL